MKRYLLLLVLSTSILSVGCGRDIDISTTKYLGEKTQNKVKKSTLNSESKQLLNLAFTNYSEEELIGKTLQEIIDKQEIDRYKSNITELTDEIITTSVELETMARSYVGVWESSIKENLNSKKISQILGVTCEQFSHKAEAPMYRDCVLKGDFNRGIEYLKKYFTNTNKFSDVENQSLDINTKIKELVDTPDCLKETYEVLVKMYNDYDKLYKLATSPSGSLLEYRKNVEEASSNLVSSYKEIDIRLPNN